MEFVALNNKFNKTLQFKKKVHSQPFKLPEYKIPKDLKSLLDKEFDKYESETEKCYQNSEEEFYSNIIKLLKQYDKVELTISKYKQILNLAIFIEEHRSQKDGESFKCNVKIEKIKNDFDNFLKGKDIFKITVVDQNKFNDLTTFCLSEIELKHKYNFYSSSCTLKVKNAEFDHLIAYEDNNRLIHFYINH